jgi:divalent metal cation (Fe/Co/Zn/Cd) transporter
MNPKAEERNRSIIKYNLIGIAMNLGLAVFKITAGIAAHADSKPPR